MTRAHFKRPVWTWFCDRCGKTSGDLATEHQDLPTPDEMRARGWFIAKTWGDHCPECVKDTHDPSAYARLGAAFAQAATHSRDEAAS